MQNIASRAKSKVAPAISASPTRTPTPSVRRGHRVIAKRWEQEIPAELVIEIGTGDRLEEMRIKATLPFLPRPGDQLGVGPDHDFIQVDEVFWDSMEGLSVWFTAEPANPRHTVSIFRQAGWQPWDEFRVEHRPL